MSYETIEIEDRTDVDFTINGLRFNVAIRDDKLRISVDGQIVVFPEAANVITVDVLLYGSKIWHGRK